MDFLLLNDWLIILGVGLLALMFGLLVKYLQNKNFITSDKVDSAQLIATVGKLILKEIDFKNDKYDTYRDLFVDVVDVALDTTYNLLDTNNKDEFKKVVMDASLLALENAHFTFTKDDKDLLENIIDLALLNVNFK